MIKIAWWKNRSISFALIAGIAAALSVYGLLASVAGVSPRGADAQSDKQQQKTTVEGTKTSRASAGKNNGRVFAALEVDDFDILKTCLVRGARVNVIYCNIVDRAEERKAETILKDVLVADVPKPSKTTSLKTQGILIDLSATDSERLAAYSDKGRLKVVISQ